MSSVQFLRLRSSKGLLHWDYFPMTCPSSPIESLSLLDWDDFYETCPFSVIGSLSLLHSDDFPKTCLPPKLRLLHWEYFPKTCLPCNFNPEFLVELKMPSSKLEKLWEGIKGCSSLVELPSSIGNITNLTLEGCSSLVELPSSIGDMASLTREGCSSHLELSSSIEDMASLTLEGCSSLVELPSSIGNMASLTWLSLKGCSKNCESLERLDCSFSSKEFRRLKFVNCFKLNQEARDLIIKTSTTESAAFPGETVPTYFTYRASGSSLSMKLNGSDTFCPTSLRFKACVLLDPKGDVEDDDMAYVIYCKIEEKLNGGIVVSNIPARILIKNSPPSKEHLYVFEFEKTVSSTELVFEFEVSNPECEIKECGIRTPETYAPSC
ncbi:unnamed protein product [Thlaspi arvense]|uniref:C-JID domain-containing protein n=1 Tax=Thlaspi arvense TaxID=13288 RepID=A0AAU9T2U1_THLAR|nr:unnamed protein product [Thlaspi arvense]